MTNRIGEMSGACSRSKLRAGKRWSGGGGAVEVAFRAALGNDIPVELFAAALVWWRFYTFYIYILLGALAAGHTVVRAVRKTEDYEVEVVVEATR